jgi:RIO kinase 1
LTQNKDDLNDEFKDELDKKFHTNIDELEKNKIDRKRVKETDQSKKKSVIESVFDERTLFQLNKILISGPIEEVGGIISAGKEANVYLAYDLDGKEVAIKIYKIDSNTSKWMRNYIIGDPRFKKIPHNISKIIFLWAQKEYKNLKRAYNVGLRVPKPLFIKNNILIMEYIGTASTPAPLLKDIKILQNPMDILRGILEFIKILYQKAKLVHADLSEFNILYYNQKPVIIDISQAVSIQHPKAEIYLARDIKNIINYFEKLSVETPDPEDFYYKVIDSEN